MAREILGKDAINEALREEMLRDETVIILGEDVTMLGSPFGTCKGLYLEFKNRVLNTPISESAIIGTALGAAMTGLRPVAEIMYADFLGCAMDQIINQVAKTRYMFGGKARVPMVIKTQQGGYVQNAAQHSQSLEALFMHIPGLKIVIPSNPYDAKGLMKTAIRDDNPVMFFDHKFFYNMKGAVPEEEYLIPFGEASIKKEGSDVTIVAISHMVNFAMEAGNKLEMENISAEIIDPRTLVPLDLKTITDSVKKTGRAVIVHEANLTCGVGAELDALISKEAFDYLDAPVERVGAKPVPIPFSEVLENAALPQVEDIVNTVKKVLARNRK